MTRETLRQHSRIIRIVATGVALILVLLFAPRMDGPRILFGIRFTTKTGAPGLTDLGWVLLVFVPILTYVVTGFVLRLATTRKHPTTKDT